jgi:uncharacterized protein (DUF1015 family)
LPLISPFRALRPGAGRAAEILAPPYDVLSSAEARELPRASRGASCIFQAEIDLDPAIDPYDKTVYAKARENLDRMVQSGALIARHRARLLRLPAHLEGRVQTGLAAVASLADYATNRVRKHELTTTGEGRRRVRQIEAVNAQTGPVMMGLSAGAGDRRACWPRQALGAPRCRRHRR